jgi:hypothetical protein
MINFKRYVNLLIMVTIMARVTFSVVVKRRVLLIPIKQVLLISLLIAVLSIHISLLPLVIVHGYLVQ